jgi:hypothetical protein
MKEKWKLLFAHEAFGQFVHKLSPFPAGNAGHHDPDPVIPPFHTVSHEEILDGFLALRPDLRRFRTELGHEYSILTQFWVNSMLWERLFDKCRVSGKT